MASSRRSASSDMVVTPYNAQIRAIQSAAAAAGLGRLQVGTVDKFQGRKRRSSSTRWRPHLPTTRPAAWSSSTTCTASMSRPPEPKPWPSSSRAPTCPRSCQTPRQMHLPTPYARLGGIQVDVAVKARGFAASLPTGERFRSSDWSGSGVQQRPPEPCAQVRILLGAQVRDIYRTRMKRPLSPCAQSLRSSGDVPDLRLLAGR